MIELSDDEQRYLMAAFAACPRNWFLPRSIATDRLPDRAVDGIVEQLNRLGMMQAQPHLHARLTDRGRRQASHLCELANRDWRKFYARRRRRLGVATITVALLISLMALKWAGIV
jgi:Mn-dependent DtxR family transcriptional regulator